MHKDKKKLVLRRESIRELDAGSASDVAGGRAAPNQEQNFIVTATVTITIVFIPTPAH